MMIKMRTVAAIMLWSAILVKGQRPSFAGSRPIGYPELANKTTTEAGLADKFGEDTTTQRLPIEANGDRDLVDRLSKLPIDQQPFWFINWQAYEAHRQKPQTYPQRPSQFVENSFPPASLNEPTNTNLNEITIRTEIQSSNTDQPIADTTPAKTEDRSGNDDPTEANTETPVSDTLNSLPGSNDDAQNKDKITLGDTADVPSKTSIEEPVLNEETNYKPAITNKPDSKIDDGIIVPGKILDVITNKEPGLISQETYFIPNKPKDEIIGNQDRIHFDPPHLPIGPRPELSYLDTYYQPKERPQHFGSYYYTPNNANYYENKYAYGSTNSDGSINIQDRQQGVSMRCYVQ